MRIVVAPDKFKGSIDSISLCTLLHKEIVALYPDAEVNDFPLSDGGDGFSTIVQHYFKTKTISTQTVDPLGRAIVAQYQFAEDTSTAYIEMAAASGLALLKPKEYDVILDGLEDHLIPSGDDALAIKIICKKLNHWYEKNRSKNEEERENEKALVAYNKQYKQR